MGKTDYTLERVKRDYPTANKYSVGGGATKITDAGGKILAHINNRQFFNLYTNSPQGRKRA